jgi:hypothetical protein
MVSMNNKDESKGFVRTTIYLPRHLHESAKIMAVLTRSNLSFIMREALAEKIKKLKEVTPMREYES